MIAVRHHSGQRDKQGLPYILHPLRVMHAVAEKTNGDPIAMSVAIMHDLLEDTDVTREELEGYGFPDNAIFALLSVTRNEKENYIRFVRRAAENTIGRIVKMADVQDNLGRIPAKLDTRWWQKLHLKYTVAIRILRGDHQWLEDNRELVTGMENA